MGVSPREGGHYEKKHYCQPVTDFSWTPREGKREKVSMRREMKERSRSVSKRGLGEGRMEGSKEREWDKENKEQRVIKNKSFYFKFY